MQFYKGKHALITGVAGFLGSHLADTLLSYGAKVVGIDNFLTGNKDNLSLAQSKDNFKFLEVDAIKDPTEYLDPEETFDLIFHFASPASPPLYQKYPIETYLINSLGTHNLLQYMLKAQPLARFIFASTSEVYGNPSQHPQTEQYWGNVNPNGLRSCYDESKRLGETICGVHFRNYNLDIRIVRIFNTYGPRMDPKDGRVIPDLVMQALQNQPLTVYGDGDQTRSFCYVSDLIQGILLYGSTEYLQGETVNIGNPNEMTINSVAEQIKSITGSASPIEHLALPADDPVKRKPDISKAKVLLGWKPEVSFTEGLKKTIEYFTKFL